MLICIDIIKAAIELGMRIHTLVPEERAAISRNAAAVIILHNHPSGDPSPSPEDIALTRSIVQAGKLLDSEVTQMTNIGVSFHASIRLDTLPEDDLARTLFEMVKVASV